MALYGVVYAVLENDARRLLAYHIISQVGYMVAAVGIGTPLAINGACAHAFAHILYKGLLFMPRAHWPLLNLLRVDEPQAQT